MATNPEFSAAVAKRRRLQKPGQEEGEKEQQEEEEEQEDEGHTLQAWGRLQRQERGLQPHLLSTIDRWGLRVQVILLTAPGVSIEGRSSPLLVLLPAVSWPWVPACGSWNRLR